jgi:hypothetical protein
MLRRIPTTPLVCLAVFLSTILAVSVSVAAGPDDSLEMLLKPSQMAPAPVPAASKGKVKATKAPSYGAIMPGAFQSWPPIPQGISKVKTAWCPPIPYTFGAQCFLPTPKPRQWDISVGAIYARTRGMVSWPRYSVYFNAWWGWENRADLNDDLGLPAHKWLPIVDARYQFKPNWAIVYSGIFGELTGGNPYVTNQFIFGPSTTGFFAYGQAIMTKWQHGYQTLGLAYDAVKNCQSQLSVFGGWMHTDDKIDLSCVYCGYYTSTFSKSADAAIVGLEMKRCIKSTNNGGTLSLDCKAAGMFLDDVEGWDLQAGGRYSIPLNCGRWGYVKAGYRYVEVKKTQWDWRFNATTEGGYVEGGFIF